MVFLWFLWTVFKDTHIEYVALDDSKGTVEIVKQSIIGYKKLHIARMGAAIGSTAFVEEHVVEYQFMQFENKFRRCIIKEEKSFFYSTLLMIF